MSQTVNYFEVFGLPRTLGIDAGQLQAKFYELSRRYHPDFQQSAPPAEQERALTLSALVNTAYRTLRDPIARIEYLVRLEEGRDTREGSAVKPAAPPELLEEIFEVQEMLEDAKASGLDDEGRNRLAAERDRLVARCRQEEELLTGALAADWDEASPAGRPRVVAAFKAALATRAYLRTVIDDLEAALDPAGETDVTHHRH
ncbi:MAG: Fe-S protein assembly co-chaperone HscB [Candidatus Rokuibacteriota bacterium]|nr:MAG: Fe-S protein assembly co-chaperone HscB [Candidatus Rokubacteria bacterium]